MIAHHEIALDGKNSASLREIREYVEKSLSEIPSLEGLTKRHIILAVDEAITSIFRNAVDYGDEETLSVFIEANDERISIQLDDSRCAFEWPEDSPVNAEHFREQRNNDLGIYLIQRIMDEISYSYRTGHQNTLTLIKFLP
ncbi:MAG: ATP-binding protein [Planctomycetota bacterium]|nr:ATP-binding protein [Planctomycetota bacterium]